MKTYKLVQVDQSPAWEHDFNMASDTMAISYGLKLAAKANLKLALFEVAPEQRAIGTCSVITSEPLTLFEGAKP